MMTRLVQTCMTATLHLGVLALLVKATLVCLQAKNLAGTTASDPLV